MVLITSSLRSTSIITMTAAILISLAFASSTVSAEVMFEGYYKILAGDQAVGYTIQRYEWDKKSKTFTCTYLIRTNAKAGSISESLKAIANDKFQPISYQYTSQVGDAIKTIDAKFNGNAMEAMVSDGKNQTKISKTWPEGTFLSSFLGYLMLQNGYSKGKKFTYNAIAEEDAQAFAGEAEIKDEVTHNGTSAFLVQNTFKGAHFISFVSPKGEILGTESQSQKLKTQLVADRSEATKGHKLPTKTLKLLFGDIPMGKKNVLAQGPQKPPQPAADKPKGKKGP